MSTSPKYLGLELDVFDRDTVLTDLSSLPTETKPPLFRRHVVCDIVGFDDLKTALDCVDAEFVRVSEACGIQVVGHHFGIFPHGRRDSCSPNKSLLPVGFHLAAEVQFIEGKPFGEVRTDIEATQLDAQIAQLYKMPGEGVRPLLRDVWADQCMIGSPVGELAADTVTLVDIGPAISFH